MVRWLREKRDTKTWRRSSDVRHVGAEKEKVYEKCGHRNTRGGRDQTKPKINVLHLLGQFAPSVGCRTVYTSSCRGRFVPRALAGRSLALCSYPQRITRKESFKSTMGKIRENDIIHISFKFQSNKHSSVDITSVY